MAGIVFGIFVFFSMRLVVLPLSAFPYPVTFKPLATTLDLLSHAVLFGVPNFLGNPEGHAQCAGKGHPSVNGT